MKRIYLDSNILIAHYSIDRAEEAKKALVENALVAFDQLKDVDLCTSVWAITEILTFDEKNDFKQIPGLVVLHPKDIKI